MLLPHRQLFSALAELPTRLSLLWEGKLSSWPKSAVLMLFEEGDELRAPASNRASGQLHERDSLLLDPCVQRAARESKEHGCPVLVQNLAIEIGCLR
jgi:hypothetical protein